MNCDSYRKMSTKEKVELIGQLTHCVQNDEHSLLVARALISTAKTKGILDNVHVWPERETEWPPLRGRELSLNPKPNNGENVQQVPY